MTAIVNTIWTMRIWRDTHGQDSLEYALIAGFVATFYGAVSPVAAASVSTVFSKVNSTLLKAGG